MKILDLNDYISEKKKINPLTIKQVKELNIGGIYDTMKSLPDSIEDFRIEEVEPIKENLKNGVFIVTKYDEQVWMYLDTESFRRTYDNNSVDRIIKEYQSDEGYFVTQSNLGFLQMLPVNEYREFLTHPNKYYDIAKLYKTNFSYTLLKNTDDLKTVLYMVRTSPLFRAN